MTRCVGDDHCATPSEFDDFVENLWVYYYINSQVYNPNDFSDGVIGDIVNETGDKIDTTNRKSKLYQI